MPDSHHRTHSCASDFFRFTATRGFMVCIELSQPCMLNLMLSIHSSFSLSVSAQIWVIWKTKVSAGSVMFVCCAALCCENKGTESSVWCKNRIPHMWFCVSYPSIQSDDLEIMRTFLFCVGVRFLCHLGSCEKSNERECAHTWFILPRFGLS